MKAAREWLIEQGFSCSHSGTWIRLGYPPVRKEVERWRAGESFGATPRRALRNHWATTAKASAIGEPGAETEHDGGAITG